MAPANVGGRSLFAGVYSPQMSSYWVTVAVVVVLVALLAWYAAQGGSESPRMSKFRPVPVSPCGAPYDDPEYGADMTGRNAAGTVVWEPYSTQSRVSLERGAESPEVAELPNPFTGVGRSASVRAMSDRYRRNEALARLTSYELQPGQPGYMEEVGDNAASLMSAVARRPPSAAPAAATPLAGTDVDTDFYTDGLYGDDLHNARAPLRAKEGLTSVRPRVANTLTAARTGLGSTRIDPRFEPGPPTRAPGGDASWSHGGHAGGPTSGGYASARFAPVNYFNWPYVYGFGDGGALGRPFPVEAVVTGQSEW